MKIKRQLRILSDYQDILGLNELSVKNMHLCTSHLCVYIYIYIMFIILLCYVKTPIVINAVLYAP